jgi:glycine dehydrogenase
MKYNPYINDWAAGLPGFTQTHPTALDQVVQGNLELLYHTQEIFKAITGLPGITTQPVAGAQGELVGLKMFQAYHADRAHLQTEIRDIILIPESAHGTNPATATYAGIQSESTKSDAKGIILIKALPNGEMDFEHLQELVNTYQKRIIGVMVTNPNTTGIFESRFHEMAKLIHAVGGLVYMDGANMNAIAGLVDLNRLGVDAVHNNLHKTWTIPHGGGGPGDAIVAVSEKLLDYLPGQQVHKNSDGSFSWFTTKKCIGSFHRHHGNFAHKVRAYTYLKALGTEGVQKMALTAVLCSQYLYKKLKKKHSVLPKGALDHPRMHEFILTFSEEEFAIMAKAGIPKAQAIGKIGKLFLDFGIHAPTVAFPEPYGLMIEPTESYTKKELDQFIEVVDTIYQMISEHPEVLLTAPHFAPISKVDELSANKDIKLSSKLETLPQYDFSFPDPVAWSKLSSQVIQEKILAQHLKIKNAH